MQDRVFKTFFITWAVILSIAVTLGFRDIRHQAEQGVQSHDAVCTLKLDYNNRIADQGRSIRSAQEFLTEHPSGIPGIPVSTLRVSIDNKITTLRNEQSTLRSLGAVKC